MSHLYEISGEYRAFQEGIDSMMEAISDGDIPEEALWDTLESLDGEFETKADSICCIIKDENAFIEDMKEEVARLQLRIRARTAAVERMKEYLTASFAAVGKTKMETPRNKVSFRKSESVSVTNAEGLVGWASAHGRNELLVYKPPELSKTAIKSALKAGEVLPGAEITVSSNIQIK